MSAIYKITEQNAENVTFFIPFIGETVVIKLELYEKEKELVHNILTEVARYALKDWLQNNYPRMIPFEKWETLNEEEMNEQIDMYNAVSEILGLRDG